MNTKKSNMQIWADWILRIALAIIFISAGYEKLTITGVENFSSMVNIPLFLGWAATLGELASGVGILIGGLMKNKTGDLITRFSGGLVAFIMVVAFLLAKIKGFSPDFIKGLENSYDVIAILALGIFYLLTGNNSHSDGKNSKQD